MSQEANLVLFGFGFFSGAAFGFGLYGIMQNFERDSRPQPPKSTKEGE